MTSLSGAERLLLKKAGIKDHRTVYLLLEAREEALRSLIEHVAFERGKNEAMKWNAGPG